VSAIHPHGKRTGEYFVHKICEGIYQEKVSGKSAYKGPDKEELEKPYRLCRLLWTPPMSNAQPSLDVHPLNLNGNPQNWSV
jgi:hypothetical protein